MRPLPTTLAILSGLTIASAVTLDCSHIRVDNKRFNFEKLGGPRNVTFVDKDHPPSWHNTTYTIDICNTLQKPKGVGKADFCTTGTNICQVKKTWNPEDDPNAEHAIIDSVLEIAGEFALGSGTSLDPKPSMLKDDADKLLGLRLELHGGRDKQKRKQKAIIDFICDSERTGNEEYVKPSSFGKRADEDKTEDSRSLTYVSYGPDDEKEAEDVLKLKWRTKYACEKYEEDDDDDKKKGDSSGWGFFTWFILIAFLGIATYLIFGSWLNYNRYGAQGWDLLPHGDTIRDIPYLVKDFSRKVVDTVSGGGSRGGYSAV